MQNYNFSQGLTGSTESADTYRFINGIRGRNYETYVGRKSNDDVDEKCLLD